MRICISFFLFFFCSFAAIAVSNSSMVTLHDTEGI